MERLRILVVDDESRMRKLVSDFLVKQEYEVLEAKDGEEALDIFFKQKDIALLILDVMMPKMDGWEVCREIRAYSKVPIIMLTAKGNEHDELQGFELGVDEYITKPFSLPEVTARIAAHLRRDERSRSSQKLFAAGGLLVNLSSRTVFWQEREISFSKREFDVIEFLITNAGQVFDRERLYEAVWGLEAEGDAGVIKEHVRRIRQKLQEVTGRTYIETVWGVGYRWNR